MPTPPPPPVHTLNLTGVLSESKRIIFDNYTHFFTLALFFLPISFYLLITPTVDNLHKYPLNHHKHLIFYIIYIVTVYTIAVCATATITYSTHHNFFGHQVNFLAGLKSLFNSFVPLVWTTIIYHVLLFLISLLFIILVVVVLVLVQILELFVINFSSIYFLMFCIVLGLTLCVILMYFHVKWSLAFVVVVVESKWGYTPLKRSAYLVKGMRLVTLFVMLYFWICGAVLVWLYSYSFQFAVSRSWTFIVVFTMLSSFSMMMCLLRITAATTVLYNYCKALHGELVIETEEGFNHDYVNLPSYLDKVPNVVTFVTTV